MEGARFLLAIVLSIAVVIVVNLLFPPTRPTGPVATDTTLVDTVGVDTPVIGTAPGAGADGGADAGEPGPRAAPGTADDPAAPATDDVLQGAPAAEGPAIDAGEAAQAGDTVWVETGAVRYGISTLGGSIVSAQLLGFESYTHGGPVNLAEPGDTELVDYAVRAGNRVLPFAHVRFETDAPAGDTLRLETPDSVALTAAINGARVALRYTFLEEGYQVRLAGRIDGLGEDATLLVGLGPRLAVHEADSAEDLRALSYVVNSRRTGIETVRVQSVEQNRVEEGPLSWVALRNKYFVVAAVEPMEGRGAFAGLVAEGGAAGARAVQASLPLDRSGVFDLGLFFGPQDHGRLAAVAEGLEDVNPYGWRIFRPIIRPLERLVTWLLLGLHDILGFGYGWVLILFGVGMRGLLWPLNAKAMRSQLKTMELQPRLQEIQAKYKERPEQLQKEMMRLYKEEGFNPLGGCLPMLLPWPILITLFFVFQNTIEFRGVEFLWLPDLSRPDPYYILPVLMGVSLFALQFMSLRAAPQTGAQQKMLMWFMPIMMTVIFLRFASGLNLYYAASNVASLPQQMQIIRERKKMRGRMEAQKSKGEPSDRERAKT